MRKYDKGRGLLPMVRFKHRKIRIIVRVSFVEVKRNALEMVFHDRNVHRSINNHSYFIFIFAGS